MKRYLLNATLFLAIIASVLATMECVVRHYPNSYRYKSQWIEANSSQVKTLILGGSHTYYALVPSALGDSTFSLANVTQHPEYDWWLLNHYIDRMPHLRTVIMPIDESNIFEPELEQGNEWHRCIYYNLYMGYPRHKGELKYSHEICNLAAFNLKLGPALLQLITGEDDLDCDSTGFGRNYDTPMFFNEEYMRRNARTTFNRRHPSPESIEYNTQYLYKIASLCHERGLRLLLVTTPMWNEYVAQYDQATLGTIKRTAQHCIDTYGAEYRNYMNDSRFQGVDFHDASHLSRQGANKFTAIYRADVGL